MSGFREGREKIHWIQRWCWCCGYGGSYWWSYGVCQAERHLFLVDGVMRKERRQTPAAQSIKPSIRINVNLRNPSSQYRSRLFRLPDEAQLHHQRLLVPLDPARLVVPVLAVGRELHVEAPHHACEDEAHFKVCETILSSAVFFVRRGRREEGRKKEMERWK